MKFFFLNLTFYPGKVHRISLPKLSYNYLKRKGLGCFVKTGILNNIRNLFTLFSDLMINSGSK